MNGNSDADLGSINTSITQSDTLAQPSCDTSERVYQCPSCDQTAGEDTIACEDCGEWFHFTCAGIDRSAAGSIIEEVPYICLLCNDNHLYIDKTVTPKSKSRIEKQNTSDPRHVNENQNTIILDSEHSDLQSQASKTKDSPIYQNISINIERNSDSEKVATRLSYDQRQIFVSPVFGAFCQSCTPGFVPLFPKSVGHTVSENIYLFIILCHRIPLYPKHYSIFKNHEHLRKGS